MVAARVDRKARRERQRVTVRCPDGGGWANVVAVCEVTPNGATGHRQLVDIVECSRGKPGGVCYPACEDQVRQLVEY